MPHPADINLGPEFLESLRRAVDVARAQLDLDGAPSSVFQGHNHVGLQSRLVAVMPDLSVYGLGINAQIPHAKRFEQRPEPI